MNKVEATNIIANAAMKCQRSNVTLNTQRKDTVKDREREDTKNKKDFNVVNEETKGKTMKNNVVMPVKQCQRSVACSKDNQEEDKKTRKTTM